MESAATPSTSNPRDYANTIGMMCVYDRTFVSNTFPIAFEQRTFFTGISNKKYILHIRNPEYLYMNIGEGEASTYLWNVTFGTNRKVVFYVQGYCEDMSPEGNGEFVNCLLFFLLSCPFKKKTILLI